MKKLSNRIRTGVLASLVVTSIVTIALVLRSERKILWEDLNHNGETLSQTLAAGCVEPLLSNNFPELETFVEEAAKDSAHVCYIKVTQTADDRDALVANYGEEPGENSPEGAQYFKALVQIKDEGGPKATLGHVEVWLSTGRLETLLAASTWRLLLGAALTFVLLAVVLGKVLRRSVLDPVDDLSIHAGRIGSGDLDSPINPTTEDELGNLALTMDKMRNNLKESYAKVAREMKEKTTALLVAQQADKVKSQFLANMSHEIRTPINGVLGCLELALSSEEPTAAGSEEFLTEAKTCASSLLTLVDDILDIARIESRSMSFELSPINPLALLSKLEGQWRERASGRGLDLDLHLQPELDLMVYTAPAEFQRLLENVVDNAIKFTDEGGIRIEAGAGEGGEPAMMVIRVSDTGAGIPPEKMEEIFLPFTQNDISSTRKFGGAGLGLSVSRQFARLLGGDILVSSKVDEGSVFTISLPLDSRQYRQDQQTARNVTTG